MLLRKMSPISLRSAGDGASTAVSALIFSPVYVVELLFALADLLAGKSMESLWALGAAQIGTVQV